MYILAHLKIFKLVFIYFKNIKKFSIQIVTLDITKFTQNQFNRFSFERLASKKHIAIFL